MAALAAATPRDYEGESIFNHLPVKSGVTVYQGGAYAIEIATGKVYVPVGNTANERFVGFADETVVGDGTTRVRLRAECMPVLSVTGVGGDDDVGAVVYATTDGDYSLTDSGSDLPIGVVHRHVSGTTCVVAARARSLGAA